MDTTRIDAVVNLWVEVSEDGTIWRRASCMEEAQETARTIREMRAILATYVAVCEAAGPRCPVMAPWFRVVMQGASTGQVLAVVPRRWDLGAGTYQSTGGEWMITDNTLAYRAWAIDLVQTRLMAA